MSDFGALLRDLGQSVEQAQWGGPVSIPHDWWAAMGGLGKGLVALADFADNLDTTATLANEIKQQLWEEKNERAAERQQMHFAFGEESKARILLFEAERKEMKAVVEAQSETLAGINRKLTNLLKPKDDLAAAHEVLEILRATPSDGAPRELVDVLRKLDVSLTTEHVARAGRKVELLQRVVQEAEDLLEEAEVSDEAGSALREALADVQDGP
jgi:hypothetical protein